MINDKPAAILLLALVMSLICGSGCNSKQAEDAMTNSLGANEYGALNHEMRQILENLTDLNFKNADSSNLKNTPWTAKPIGHQHVFHPDPAVDVEVELMISTDHPAGVALNYVKLSWARPLTKEQMVFAEQTLSDVFHRVYIQNLILSSVQDAFQQYQESRNDEESLTLVTNTRTSPENPEFNRIHVKSRIQSLHDGEGEVLTSLVIIFALQKGTTAGGRASNVRDIQHPIW